MDINNLPKAVILAKQLKLVDDYAKVFKGERIVTLTVARTPIKRADIKTHLNLNSQEQQEIDTMFTELETKLALFFDDIKTNIVKQIKAL